MFFPVQDEERDGVGESLERSKDRSVSSSVEWNKPEICRKRLWLSELPATAQATRKRLRTYHSHVERASEKERGWSRCEDRNSRGDGDGEKYTLFHAVDSCLILRACMQASSSQGNTLNPHLLIPYPSATYTYTIPLQGLHLRDPLLSLIQQCH